MHDAAAIKILKRALMDVQFLNKQICRSMVKVKSCKSSHRVTEDWCVLQHLSHYRVSGFCFVFFLGCLEIQTDGWQVAVHISLGGGFKKKKKGTCMCLTFVTLEPDVRSRFELLLPCVHFPQLIWKNAAVAAIVLPLSFPVLCYSFFHSPPLCSFLALVARQHQVVFGGTEKY